jgi:hypothetical protein
VNKGLDDTFTPTAFKTVAFVRSAILPRVSLAG